VPVPFFLLFLCFRKATQEIFLELDKTKVDVQSRDGGEPGARHTLGRRSQPLARATRGCGLLVHFLTPPLRLYILLDEKTLMANQFSRNISQAAIVVDPRSGGSISSSRQPTGEGNHHRRPSSSPCPPPE
jgi:hypothetical protein